MTYYESIQMLTDLYNKTDQYWYLYLVWLAGAFSWIGLRRESVKTSHKAFAMVVFWFVSGMDAVGLLITYGMMSAARLEMLDIINREHVPAHFSSLTWMDPFWMIPVTVAVHLILGVAVSYWIWKPKWIVSLVPKR